MEQTSIDISMAQNGWNGNHIDLNSDSEFKEEPFFDCLNNEESDKGTI